MIAAALAFFSGISAKVWGYIAIVVALMGLVLYVYHLGGEAPRAELARVVAAVADAKKAHAAEDARRLTASVTLVNQEKVKHEKEIAVIGAGYESYIARLRHTAASVAGAGPEPVVLASSVCHDPAADSLVSAAVEKYRLDVRAAHDEYREGVARLLESGEKQTAQLINLQESIAGIKQINKE